MLMKTMFVQSILVLLACSSAAFARRIKEEFNFHFDVGGETQRFTHNSPKNGKVSWVPGGALESLGALKVTGSVASFERYDWFKSGADKTISFHYYVHGYSRLQMRLNLAHPDQREKFDKCAFHGFENLPQDKWIHFQVKITDLVGIRHRDRKATADLVFKSLTLIAQGSRESKPFIMIDNVRLGPAVEESSIVVKKRGTHSFGTDKKTLLDFEDSSELKLLKEAGAKISHADKGVTSGSKSAKLVFERNKPWPGLQFGKALVGDWSGYDYLSFDLTTDDPEVMEIAVELQDVSTKSFGTRCTYEGLNKLPPVHKGKTTVLVDLRRARRNNKEGKTTAELVKADLADLSKITMVKMWIPTKGRETDYVTYIDNVQLLQEGALKSNMKIDVPEGALAFDFGENSPLVQGFTEVNLLDAWGPEKKYGFVSTDSIRSEGRDWPDPLTGDYIAPGHNEEGKWRGGSFEFRIRVPNGKYLAWVNAGFFPYPNVYIDLSINNELMYDAQMDYKTFYTKRWYHRFLNTNYSEKKNALWENYVSKISPGYVVETEVTRGEFCVKGTNSFIGALILMPVSERAAFDKLVAQIKSERMRYFYSKLYLNRPANQPCRVKDQNFVMFVPDEGRRIKPWSGMGSEDKEIVDLLAAQGEAVPFQVAVRPFKDFDRMTMKISDLRGPNGSLIPSSAVKVYFKKYLSNGMKVHDWGLSPMKQLKLEKDLVRSFWFRFRVPTAAVPGAYTATITAKAGTAVKTIPVKLEVCPFTLADDLPVSFGLYYDSPFDGQHNMYEAFKPAIQPQLERMMKEQAELMRDFGLTASQVPSPRVTELRGNGAIIDLTDIQKATTAMREAGMLANEHQRAMPYMLSIGRAIGSLLRRTGSRAAKELDHEGFSTAYVSAARKLQQWADDEGISLAMWTVDEPREDPNPWNRNYDDTIRYLKLLKKVPNAKRLVTPMGDKSRGKSYVGMLDHLEIVATHPTPHSTQIIKRGLSDDKLDLWIYNAGRDRYSNGFYVWRMNARGKFEWHFSFWKHERTGRSYMGIESHNPFLNYEYSGTFMSAPLKYKGGVLPQEKIMTMSIGINDYRYAYTLEQLIKANEGRSEKAVPVAEAKKLLASIKSQIESIPTVKGLKSAADLDKVGAGISGPTGMVKTWRKQIARAIIKLK